MQIANSHNLRGAFHIIRAVLMGNFHIIRPILSQNFTFSGFLMVCGILQKDKARSGMMNRCGPLQGCSLLVKVFGTLAGCSVYAKICTTDVTNAVQIMANKCRMH